MATYLAQAQEWALTQEPSPTVEAVLAIAEAEDHLTANPELQDRLAEARHLLQYPR